MNLWGFLIKALIFKPKKSINGWEHKNGFFVPFEDVKSALSIIESERNKRSYSKRNKNNYYQQLDRETLRNLASQKLYEIESSSHNYIEIIIIVLGLGIIVYLLDLITVIWSYPSQDTVRLFLALVVALACISFLYFKKTKIDKNNVEIFLDIEDALFQHEYGRSQYKD